MKFAMATAAVILVGGVVLAHEGHGKLMQQHINQRVEDTIDAAKPTPEQRARLEQAKQRVFDTFAASHGNRKDHMEKVIALFEAEKVDAAQVKALRDEHEATARADGDAIVAALTEAHETLQPQQRKAVADYIRAHKPEGPPKAVGEWFKKRAYAHMNDALDHVKASAEQRKAVENAIDQVWASVREEHEAGAGHIDAALKIFEADRLDKGAIEQLRNQQHARSAKIGDAITQAFHDVHDALTSAQRKELVAWVRANHPHM